MEPMQFATKVLLGAGVGFFYAAGGYAKAKKESDKTEFEGFKFCKTILLGAILGGITAGAEIVGIAVTEVQILPFITPIVEKFLKAIFGGSK